MHERPDRAWGKVGCDLFYLNQTAYLLIADYYSHFLEVEQLSGESSRQVIVHLKSQFARHGIPSTLMSDGGPQLKSEEFRQFVAEWGIKHVMSSPYFPRSNGLAENGVKIVKRLLSKAAQERRGSVPGTAGISSFTSCRWEESCRDDLWQDPTHKITECTR